MQWLKDRGAQIVGFVSAVASLAAGFGLPISNEQQGLIVGAVAALLGVILGRRPGKGIANNGTAN